MALVKATLKSALLSMFNSLPPTPTDAAQQMADAYQTYVDTAMAGEAAPAYTGSEKTLLKATLLQAIQDPNIGTASKMADAWSQGVQTFWTSPPVNFSGSPGPGAVTAFPGVPALNSALLAVFSNLSNTAEAAADGIATALDTATKTVTVTLVPPPPAPPVVVTLS